MDATDETVKDDAERDPVDNDLYQRTKALLEPGDIELNGVIVHTEYDGQQDLEMMDATLAVGDVIAERGGTDPGDVYVYSGNDDPDFSSNQHQGLTIDGVEVVGECKQVLRDGRFHLVFYYESSADQDGILADVREAGYEATGVEG